MPLPTDDDDGAVLEPVPRADDDDDGAVVKLEPRADDDDGGAVLEPVPRADDDDGGAVVEPEPRADDDEGWSDGQRPSRGDLILEACVDAAVDYAGGATRTRHRGARSRSTPPPRASSTAPRTAPRRRTATVGGSTRASCARPCARGGSAAAALRRPLREVRQRGAPPGRHGRPGDARPRPRAPRRRRQAAAMAGRVKSAGAAREPVAARAADKALFTLGVGWVVATEYVVLARPEHFGAWYVASLAPLLAHRVVTYRRRRWAYFCLDFCYALNALCMGLAVAALAGGRARGRLFALAFALANGPCSAILVWRNSFIFHSLDHVTSTALHALPPMWTYAVRWGGGGDAGRVPGAAGRRRHDAAWQALYVLKTEVVDAAYLRSTPDESTSLRWIARDGKNAMNRLCKGVLVSGGLMRRDEDFDPGTRKTKLTFWAAQLLYTVVTLAPAPLMWRSRRTRRSDRHSHDGRLQRRPTASAFSRRRPFDVATTTRATTTATTATTATTIDAGAIEAIISGQASSDTGYSPVIQVINATEIKNNQTGAGSGRCAPARPSRPAARGPTRPRADPRTFFKEVADKVFPLLEEGKVYVFQETSGRLKPSNKQYTSIPHEFEVTFGNVTVEPADDDGAIARNVGDWKKISMFADGGGPREGNVDIVGVIKAAFPAGQITSKRTGQELTKREVVLCDDSGYDVRLTFWGELALRDDAFFEAQPVLAAKGLRVSDFGGVSLSSGFGSQLIFDGQEDPESLRLRAWWTEGGGREAPTVALTGASGGSGAPAAFGDRIVLDDIKGRQLGFGEKPDYVTFKGTLNFVKTDRLWYEACAQEGCQKKVVQNSDGTWHCEKCQATNAECKRRYLMSSTFVDDSAQSWVSAFNDHATKIFLGVNADDLASTRRRSRTRTASSGP
ncbi:hypothetical protein JL721_8024 [Aureococcus anophagefferens]|nr:hypothetical protein JL721_8024 [Aureococcus anophagefferens]